MIRDKIYNNRLNKYFSLAINIKTNTPFNLKFP